MVQKSKKIIQPYIKHDENASQDGKILRLCLDFRKLAKDMTKEELESFVSHGAYALFWRILEFMHGNKLLADDVELLADNLRIDTKFINQILNNYDLFRIEEGEYISDRLLRDLERQEEKSKTASDSVQVRWLLSAFNKDYTEFFGEAPILEPSEIEALKKYSEKIPDLKKKFRDIFYTLKSLEFDKKNYKPCANWLLKGNNLARLLNGEFGALKHKKTEQEMKEEQRKLALKKEEKNKPTELELKLKSLTGKEDLLAFIADEYSGKKVVLKKGKVLINPEIRNKAEEFGVVDEEIQKACGL